MVGPGGMGGGMMGGGGGAGGGNQTAMLAGMGAERNDSMPAYMQRQQRQKMGLQ